MVTQTTKVKNGTIILPKEFRKSWKEAEVFISGEKDTIIMKRIKAPSFLEMLKEFREIGKSITKKEVREAIKWARRKEVLLKK